MRGKGFLVFLLLAALAFGGYAFYDYYRVESVEVLSEGRYSEDEVRAMVLKGFAAQNSFLAPRFLSQEGITTIPFVESLRVTSLARDKIALIVIEKKPVGCLQYLGSYIYFDRNGIFIEGQWEREPYIPYFSTLHVNKVVRGERLDMKGRSTVLSAAVTLSSFMTKNQMEVDSVEFDENYHFYFRVDKIQVNLGTTDLLDEKLSRVREVLPKLAGKSGILHAEIVTDNNKNLSFENLYVSEAEYPGGYEADGEYTGTGYYDEKGVYIGPYVFWQQEDMKAPEEEEAEGEAPAEGEDSPEEADEKPKKAKEEPEEEYEEEEDLEEEEEDFEDGEEDEDSGEDGEKTKKKKTDEEDGDESEEYGEEEESEDGEDPETEEDEEEEDLEEPEEPEEEDSWEEEEDYYSFEDFYEYEDYSDEYGGEMYEYEDYSEEW